MAIKFHHPALSLDEPPLRGQYLLHRWFDRDVARAVRLTRERIGFKVDTWSWDGRPIAGGEGGPFRTIDSGPLKTRPIWPRQLNENDPRWSGFAEEALRSPSIDRLRSLDDPALERTRGALHFLWEALVEQVVPVICVVPGPLVKSKSAELRSEPADGSPTRASRKGRRVRDEAILRWPFFPEPGDAPWGNPIPRWRTDANGKRPTRLGRFHSVVVVGVDPGRGVLIQDPNEAGRWSIRGLSFDGPQGVKYLLERRYIDFATFLIEWGFWEHRQEGDDAPAFFAVTVQDEPSKESELRGYSMLDAHRAVCQCKRFDYEL